MPAERHEGARRAGAESAGRVYLVGAGPGDPGLLSARALELIGRADVILYDRLVGPGALDGAPASAELLFVGKEGGGSSVPQEHTEALMVERAEEGKNVVRLKGGDPFVFGRGGEEALTLKAAGIEWEVVPGVTAGVGAAAYAGIPVTHRGLATAVAFVTGHTSSQDDEQGPPLQWDALAAFPGTLVFYMGVRQLAAIASSLIASGRDSGEPAAIVEAGTLARQRTVTGTLATIAAQAEREQVRAPSITIVGPVAGLAGELDWLAARPLHGLSVTVTRARAAASGIAARLRELGAQVVQAPAIELRPLPGPPLDPAPYDLICVTSPNGVEQLFERLAAADPPRDARSLAHATVAAIGPGTARALAAHGINADVVGERSVAESLAQALEDVSAQRALVARPARARDVLPDALAARGIEVDLLELYETVPAEPAAPLLEAALEADYVTFTSSSTVRFYLQAIGGAERLAAHTRIVSIGPVTSETLRDYGLEPHVEAQRHDPDGLLDALLADAASRSEDGVREPASPPIDAAGA